MLKRLFVYTLVIALAFSCFAISVSAEETNFEIAFSTDVMRVGDTAVFSINVPTNVNSITAFFSDNGKLALDRSNMQYDSSVKKYKVVFNVENGVCEITVTAKYIGTAVFSLTDITLQTDASSLQVGEVQAEVLIKAKAVPIYTKQEFNNIRNDLSGNYVLMNDIEFTEEDFAEGGEFYNDGYGWQPIGSSLSTAFKGSLDGNGFAVKGIRVYKADYNYIGLFGVNFGTIENIALVDANIDAIKGVFVPTTESSVPSGDIDYESKDVWTPPTGSVNDSDLSGYDRTGLSSAIVGGIAAYNVGTLADCYVNGEIFATPAAGGIVGSNVGSVERCYANVELKAKAVGGVSAYNLNHGLVSDCHAKGTVVGSALAGGICGENRSSTIKNCYTLVRVSGEGDTAGASNGEYYSTVENVYYLKDENVSDTAATALESEGFANITFSDDCWDYSTDFPVLKKLSTYILNEQEEKPETLKGDVNGDGDTNASDLAILKKVIAGLTAIDDDSVKAPDVDGSGGTPNAADLAMLKKIIAGLPL